jgi:hypothetical protein
VTYGLFDELLTLFGIFDNSALFGFGSFLRRVGGEAD